MKSPPRYSPPFLSSLGYYLSRTCSDLGAKDNEINYSSLLGNVDDTVFHSGKVLEARRQRESELRRRNGTAGQYVLGRLPSWMHLGFLLSEAQVNITANNPPSHTSRAGEPINSTLAI